MTVQLLDLDRLAGEILRSGLDPEGWCAHAGIDFDAVKEAIRTAIKTITEDVDGEDCMRVAAVAAALGQIFRLGWETRDQYGPPREDGL